MYTETKWMCQCKAKEMVGILEKKRYNAIYAENFEEAKKIVLDLVPKNSSISFGVSNTIADMDIIDHFRSQDYKLYDRFQNLPFPEIVEIMRQSMVADYLITSVNAITKQGELVCMDCSGSRAAGMIFGPRKVIVIAGTNKIVDDLDEGIKRAKRIAPINVKRLNHNAPCKEDGICTDCDAEGRVCNYLSVIKWAGKFENRITVIMVADESGY
jgi:hypothetical protein